MLKKTTHLDSDRLQAQTTPLPPRAALPMYDRDTAELLTWKLGLWLPDQHQMIGLEINTDTTLGRQGLDTFDTPHVDLTAFGAHEVGVSRVHAQVVIHNKGLAIQDLGSTNGTYLNGYRIESFVDVPLHHDDLLELGGLTMRVSFLHR